MNPGTRNTQQGWMPGRWIASRGLRAGVCLLLSSLLLAIPGAWAQGGHGGARGGGGHPAAPARPANPGPRMNGNGNVPHSMRPMPHYGRMGQEHLPEWLSQHQNLSPQQQENLLRREPGFNRLGPEQQQRVLNQLRNLDSRSPVQRQRWIQRNEMFERLSPEQRQDVRGAAQSMTMMPQDRQAMMRRAFNDLRQIPPNQRQEILNSARFSHTFSPQERHVLGSLLSIEPYQPR